MTINETHTPGHFIKTTIVRFTVDYHEAFEPLPFAGYDIYDNEKHEFVTWEYSRTRTAGLEQLARFYNTRGW